MTGTDDLEGRARAEAPRVRAAGLSDDEERLVALVRLARVDPSVRVEARRRAARQLDDLVAGDAAPTVETVDRGVLPALTLAAVAALGVQVARIVAGAPAVLPGWLAVDASLLVLPLLAILLARRRGAGWAGLPRTLAPFALAALVVNVMPLADGSASLVLAATHLPVVLWFVALRPLVPGRADAPAARLAGRMRAVRFSAEWFVAYVLVALGGVVLVGLTTLVVAPFGEGTVEQVVVWVVPSGAAGAVLVVAWVVDTGHRVTHGAASLLTAVFTPLFALMLTAAAIAHASTGAFRGFDRETLVVFDALLVVVLALVVHGVATRGTGRVAALQARVRVVATVAAVALDGLVLVSMVGRVAGFGATPNRVAALGLNIILFVVLAGTAWLGARALARGEDEERVERWLGACLPVVALWAAVVAVVIPAVFGFA